MIMALVTIIILVCVIAGLLVGMAVYAAGRGMRDDSFYTHEHRTGRWDKKLER